MLGKVRRHGCNRAASVGTPRLPAHSRGGVCQQVKPRQVARGWDGLAHAILRPGGRVGRKRSVGGGVAPKRMASNPSCRNPLPTHLATTCTWALQAQLPSMPSPPPAGHLTWRTIRSRPSRSECACTMYSCTDGQWGTKGRMGGGGPGQVEIEPTASQSLPNWMLRQQAANMGRAWHHGQPPDRSLAAHSEETPLTLKRASSKLTLVRVAKLHRRGGNGGSVTQELGRRQWKRVPWNEQELPCWPALSTQPRPPAPSAALLTWRH